MAAREKKNTVQIRVFIPPEVYEKMQDEADTKGTTISGLTRMVLLERYAEQDEK